MRDSITYSPSDLPLRLRELLCDTYGDFFAAAATHIRITDRGTKARFLDLSSGGPRADYRVLAVHPFWRKASWQPRYWRNRVP